MNGTIILQRFVDKKISDNGLNSHLKGQKLHKEQWIKSPLENNGKTFEKVKLALDLRNDIFQKGSHILALRRSNKSADLTHPFKGHD